MHDVFEAINDAELFKINYTVDRVRKNYININKYIIYLH